MSRALPALLVVFVLLPSAFGQSGGGLVCERLDASIQPGPEDPVAARLDLDCRIPLTWVGRSLEAPGAVAAAAAVGEGVDAARGLPLAPGQPVFDDGVATDAAWKAGVPAGVHWASWPQYASCGAAAESRLFRATFLLNDLASGLRKAKLYAPPYEGHRDVFDGNIVPVNDNVYVFLNGHAVARLGVSYGAVNLGNAGDAPVGNEAGGWVSDGRIGPVGDLLRKGENTLDLVAEEGCFSGGLAELSLKLGP